MHEKAPVSQLCNSWQIDQKHGDNNMPPRAIKSALRAERWLGGKSSLCEPEEALSSTALGRSQAWMLALTCNPSTVEKEMETPGLPTASLA